MDFFHAEVSFIRMAVELIFPINSLKSQDHTAFAAVLKSGIDWSVLPAASPSRDTLPHDIFTGGIRVKCTDQEFFIQKTPAAAILVNFHGQFTRQRRILRRTSVSFSVYSRNTAVAIMNKAGSRPVSNDEVQPKMQARTSLRSVS